MPIPTESIKISQLTQATSSAASDEFPMNQSGVTKKTNPALLSTDWKNIPVLPTTITYLGNRSYQATFPGVDYSTFLANKMRLRFERTVSSLLQCASLNGTNQYLNRTGTITGMSWTDDFATGMWVKMTAYSAAVQAVFSRYNGTSGWVMQINPDGTINFVGYNGGSGNFSYVGSKQSLPINKWVYIASQLDASAFTATTTTSYIMLDGVDIPVSVGRAGSNPTSISQAGNIEVGSANGGTIPFNGRIAQVWISSAKVTQANVRTLMSQGLTSSLISTNNIASAFSLSNSLSDLNTTNANNLSAQNSATTTNADAPWGQQGNSTLSATIDFGVITGVSAATDTVVTFQVPEGCTVPTSGGISAISYATTDSPYGFPSQKERWSVDCITKARISAAGATQATVYNIANLNLNLPAGSWRIVENVTVFSTRSGSGTTDVHFALGTSTTTNTIPLSGMVTYISAITDVLISLSRDFPYTVTTATPLYYQIKTTQPSMTQLSLASDYVMAGDKVSADFAYV